MLLSRCSTHLGRSSTQSPMWFRGGIWTLGDFSGSRGVMISTSTLPSSPLPHSNTSSSTFSLSLLNELTFPRPRVSIQNFCKSPLFKLPSATCWTPKMLKGRYQLITLEFITENRRYVSIEFIKCDLFMRSLALLVFIIIFNNFYFINCLGSFIFSIE